jgi:hypothetical protein
VTVPQQVIARFQNLVTYGERAIDLNARTMNELDLVNLDAVVLQQENETNATDLNARAMNELDLVNLNVVVLQPEN